MSQTKKTLRPHRRKATDEQIISLNALGLSLRTIGEMLQVHHTTAQKRLTELSIPLADTRRSFMDDVVKALSIDEAQWLVDQLGPAFTVKDFFVNMTKQQYLTSRSKSRTSETPS